jgi:hypothetical protein
MANYSTCFQSNRPPFSLLQTNSSVVVVGNWDQGSVTVLGSVVHAPMITLQSVADIKHRKWTTTLRKGCDRQETKITQIGGLKGKGIWGQGIYNVIFTIQ